MPNKWNMRKHTHLSWKLLLLALGVFITLWLIASAFIKPELFEHTTSLIFILISTGLVLALSLPFGPWGIGERQRERREKQTRAQDSEAHFRTLLDSAPDAIVIVDPNGMISIVNAQTEKWFGYQRSELIGQPVEILVPDRFRNHHLQYRTQYSHTPSTRPMGANAELYGRRKDGSEFPLEISLSPSQINGRIWVTSIVRDVSARKQMEIERQLAQTRYSELVNNLPVGVFRITDKNSSRFREVNPAMVDIFAAGSAEKLLNTPCEILFVNSSDWHLYQKQLHSESRTSTLEVKMRTLDDQIFIASITTAVNQSPTEGIYCDGILENITERKHQEEHIQKLNEDLQRRSQELVVINRELESFSYSVSHDLRAPLRAMDGFSSTLLREYGPQLDQRGRERLERVRAAAQRMATLIDDLLNLSRVSRSDIVWQAVDLAELAREIIADLQQTDPHREIQFHVQTPLLVKADHRLMTIVLTNLLSNAWKFTSRTDKARIEFTLDSVQGAPVYCVRDNGAGFDMEFSAKLFGAFQRLHDTNEFPGTGIGLATVQRIIHKHGGRIWAEGAVNQGAAFYFTIESLGES